MPARGTVAVHSLGCKANREEMECLLSRLAESGYRVVPFGQAADWVVVNTCTVTLSGDSDSRQMIRRAAASKGGGRLVVTGCMAQRDPATSASIPGVDWVIGNGEKPRLARWILGEDRPSRPAGSGAWVEVAADPTLSEFALYGAGREGRRTRATLKVQDGCDEHCTFCVIPRVRGRSRSRPLEEVVREARKLADGGYREISLTGINTALWGRDLPGGPELPDLCDALGTVDGCERIRLNSLEPQYLTAEWWERLAANPRICPHFHLPLQSGEASILRRMNRAYTPALYAEVVRRIATQMPEAAIGCDILVGFPGESEEQFESAFGFLSRLPLAYLHVFSYSPRPDTAALRLGPPVPVALRQERSLRLRNLDRELRRRFAARQAGTVQAVLPEGPCGAGEWQGLTGNYLRVRFPWTPTASPAMPLVLLEETGNVRWMRGRPLAPRWEDGRGQRRGR